MDYNQRRTSSRCSKTSDPEQEKRRFTLSNIASNTYSNMLSSRQTSISYSAVQSQWEILMRKFSHDCKKDDHNCNIQIPENDGEITCEQRPLKCFTTGSSYEGTWDPLGMCGYGVYTFPDGVVYEGEFEDNLFHGNGEMRYPDGTTLRGRWNHGENIERTIVFDDGVSYKEENWEYCRAPDRRFSQEYYDGIQPGGKSYLTNDLEAQDIPPGMYDTGDGLLDPATDTVFDYTDPGRIIRSVDDDMKKWMIANCRKSPDEVQGPRPEFYEEWLEPKLEAEVPQFPSCLSDVDYPGDEPRRSSQRPSMFSMFRSRSMTSRRSTFRYDPRPSESIERSHLNSFDKSPRPSVKTSQILRQTTFKVSAQ